MKHFGSTSGLTVLAEDQATQANSMVAHVTSSYNSGYQNGDIKGAFLSDTDDTDLVGSGELVTNGTFDTDVSGWTSIDTSTFSVSSGQVTLTNNGTVNGKAYQAITTVVGQRYVITVDLISLSLGRGRVGISASVPSSGAFAGQLLDTPSVGSFAVYFVASATTTYLAFGNRNDTDATSVWDNISVKLADADRSVNNNGLVINGTVTRSPVATGADLVAYSGFSSSNYLEQPYNPDYDFGTGDFCVMGWVKTSSTSDGALFHRALDGFDGGIYFRMTGGKLFVYLSNSTGYNLALSGTVSINTGSWVFVVVSRKGGVAYLHVSGSLDVSAANVADLTYAGAISRFGVRTLGTAALTGSLALWRISATAPTAEQIAKIYNDEKVLFQENAQATLYGSSDAVTALAHDDATNLLHVGTSAGRSVFQGLRRVDNTTTAVGTAISASNGLVVEE